MKNSFKKKKICKKLKIFIFLIFLIIYYPEIIIENYICSKRENKNIFNLYNNSIGNKNKTSILLEGKQYINKCLNNQSFTKVYSINIIPKISVIIPVYNSEKTICYSICSIQNQNYTDFEIILIDDFSRDVSLKMIENLQKLDSRIKIVRNKKNMGSLYSRNIGVLMAKGEYLFGLDNDDLFFSKDIFYCILKVTQETNFDIVGFRALKFGSYEDNLDKITDLYNYKHYKNNTIVFQPKLSTWIVSVNGHYRPHDVTIWAKCFKTKIYKEAIIKLGIKRYSIFVSWAEDNIMNFIIFNLADSFIFIHKYGIIHLHSKSTASFTLGKEIQLFGELFFIDVIYDFSKNNSDKNYAVMGLYNIKKVFRINKFVNNTNLIYLKSILPKFLKCQYFSKKIKNRIKRDFKDFFS